MKLFDGSGRVLVALQPSRIGVGGELAVAGAEPGLIARLGSYGRGALGLRFYKGDTFLGVVGASTDGGLLQLSDTAGTPMARVYNNGTSGTVGIYNAEGKTKGLLATTASGDAEFDLFHADGATPAVQLSEVAVGGYLALTNDAGIARVEAGTTPTSDQGIVRVYGPGGFDYIRGMK